MNLKIELEIKTPIAPNFVEAFRGDTKISISVKELTNKQIDELAKNWAQAIKDKKEKEK